MSFQKGAWRKSTTVEKVMFEIKELTKGGRMQFPDWLMMADAACTWNYDVPWVSCSNGFTLFVFNPDTNDAMMASTGLWVLKEKMISKGLPQPPIAADVLVLRCE
jgi:hypothetical protein